jgi:transposase
VIDCAPASWSMCAHIAAAVGATGAVLDRLRAAPRRDVVAIEGTGSFGAGLTTALLARCERIVEVNRPQRPARRGGVKSDDIDAVRAARQALAGVGQSLRDQASGAGPLRPQPPARRRAVPAGVRRVEQFSRSPRVLRSATSPRSHPRSSPTHPREPARRHPM